MASNCKSTTGSPRAYQMIQSNPTPDATEIEAIRPQLRRQAPTQLSEEFDDLVLDPASPNYVENALA